MTSPDIYPCPRCKTPRGSVEGVCPQCNWYPGTTASAEEGTGSEETKDASHDEPPVPVATTERDSIDGTEEPVGEVAPGKMSIGFVLIAVVAGISLLVWGLTMKSMTSIRQKQKMSCNINLKLIGLAFHNYHDVYIKFPTDNPPFGFFDAFPKGTVMTCPSHTQGASGPGYVLVSGEGFLADGEDHNFADIRDGVSNTILVVEYEGAKHGEPVTFEMYLKWLRGGGAHNGGHVAMCDGSTRLLETDIDEDKLRAMFTYAGDD